MLVSWRGGVVVSEIINIGGESAALAALFVWAWWKFCGRGGSRGPSTARGALRLPRFAQDDMELSDGVALTLLGSAASRGVLSAGRMPCCGGHCVEGVGVLRLRGARFAYPASLRMTSG
jgi:hypothetical protein